MVPCWVRNAASSTKTSEGDGGKKFSITTETAITA